jgi:hypothetical protein
MSKWLGYHYKCYVPVSHVPQVWCGSLRRNQRHAAMPSLPPPVLIFFKTYCYGVIQQLYILYWFMDLLFWSVYGCVGSAYCLFIGLNGGLARE